MKWFFWIGLLAVVLLAAPASAWTPMPTPTPTATPTAVGTGMPTATPTAMATASPTATPIAKVPQQRTVAVLLINSPDGTSVLSAQTAEELVWTNPIVDETTSLPAVRNRYLWGSYDIIEFLWDGNDDEAYDIFGPYETEWNADGECYASEWSIFAKAAALATNPELADYDHIIYSLPWVDESGPRPNSCPWGGLGGVGTQPVWLNAAGANYITHEIGHNLGFTHFGDPTDLGSGPLAGLSVPHLIFLGLMPSARVVEATNEREQEFTLLPIAVDPYDVSGVRVVNLEAASGDPYWISFRDDTGMDTYIGSEYQFKVYIHRWDGITGAASALDWIGNGETFVNEDKTFRITVTTMSEGGQGWEAGIEIVQIPDAVIALRGAP